MVDRRAAARAIEDFLRALGHVPEGDLEGTGERVADAWADDLLEGESIDAGAVLREGSIAVGTAHGMRSGLVVVRDLAVTTVCPHHLLPAQGTGLIAYLPGDRLAGIGTLAHVLDALARRLTLQERIGAEVVTLLAKELGARGALCRLALTHSCLVARGERKPGAVVETIAVAGTFAHPSPDRELALSVLGRIGGP
jgi:GTP cyclohydrolase I